MGSYMWKLHGRLEEGEEIQRYDAYECFPCCLVSETVSSVVFIPDSVIERRRPGKLDELKKKVETMSKEEISEGKLRSGFAFVVGTTEGTMHVFSSFSPPVKMFSS